MATQSTRRTSGEQNRTAFASAPRYHHGTQLRAIQRALKPTGAMMWSEGKASDRLEENLNPWGRSLYGASTMHCMTVSLAQGGEGLGTVVGGERARELAVEAGFSGFARLPLENPVHQVFVLRK